jgi:ADP-heptose:LPS heptosyltransferase
MTPSKILLIKLRALGDTILATAPLLELQRAYPNSNIQILVPKAWASLFDGFSGIQKIWTYERKNSATARARSLARLAYHLRQEKFDCVINLHASPSSSLLAFSTGARLRSIHFHGHTHRNRYSTVEIPDKGILKPVIERDMDTLRALGIDVPAGRLPHLPIQMSEIQEANSFIQQIGLKPPILGLGLGASRPTKIWPMNRFALLAFEWAQKTEGSVIAFSGPTEASLQKVFLDEFDRALSLSALTTQARAETRRRVITVHDLPLRKLTSLLSQISVFAGNDSGPRHLAVALGTPTLTLFGPEHPIEWHPYPKDRHPYLFHENLPCRKDVDPGMPPWCGIQECTLYDHQCMKLIGVDSVLAECLRINRS